MAISKNIENEYGAIFTYHKLQEVRIISDDSVQLVMTVYSWINKQARIDGKQPTVRQCIIDRADFAMSPFYTLLKAKFDNFSFGADDMDNSFKQLQDVPLRPEFAEQTGLGQLIKRWNEPLPEEEPEPEEAAAEETAEPEETSVIKEEISPDVTGENTEAGTEPAEE